MVDVHPDASEIPNQIDDNCNGEIDENTEWFDDDGDGFSEREGDCDDDTENSESIYPEAEEIDNGVDDNCDGRIDEGFDSWDDDGDGYSEDEGDCNDFDPWVYEGAKEYCDFVDNDCDGITDEGEDSESGEEIENGACSFIVEREAEEVYEEEISNTGCQHTDSKNSPWIIFSILLIVGIGRFRTSL